jgi:putative transposase
VPSNISWHDLECERATSKVLLGIYLTQAHPQFRKEHWQASATQCSLRESLGMTNKSHRKTVKHYHRPGDLHELTFSCYRQLPLLTNDEWRKLLSKTIDEALVQTSIQLVAFVYMPEHVHLLVDPLEAEPRLPELLAMIKQPFSHEIRKLLQESRSSLLEKLTIRERPGKESFRFWQEGPGYDRNLQKPSTILTAIDYLHMNPVRRGLVLKAIDWKWSSARWYLNDPPRQQDPDLPTIHGLRYGSLDVNFAE